MSTTNGPNLLLAMELAYAAGRVIMEVYSKENFSTEIKKDNSPVTEADHLANEIITDGLKGTGIPVLSEEGREIPYEERKHWNEFWLVDPLDGTKEFIRRNGEFTVNIALVDGKQPRMGVIYAPNYDLMYAAESSLGAWRMNSYSTLEIRTYEDVLDAAEKLPLRHRRHSFGVVASRSHRNEETELFIKSLQKEHPDLQIVSRGSSLKFCLVAEGSADIYPRYGPTMEWDTGAGHAIAEFSGCMVRVYGSEESLDYNKENLINPRFVVRRS